VAPAAVPQLHPMELAAEQLEPADLEQWLDQPPSMDDLELAIALSLQHQVSNRLYRVTTGSFT